MTTSKRAMRAYLRERIDTGDALFTGREGNLGIFSMQKLFKRYTKKAGLDSSFSIHCVRYSIAVHSLETDYVDIQDLLGHLAIQNTLVYAQITDKRRSQVDKLLANPR